MKKTQKPETKKKQQGQKEKSLNQELLKVEKAFATGLRAGPIIQNGGGCAIDNGDT